MAVLADQGFVDLLSDWGPWLFALAIVAIFEFGGRKS